MKFGILFRHERMKRGLSQRQCSMMVTPELDRSYLAKLESGGQEPSLKILIALVKTLGMNATEQVEFVRRLIFEDDEPVLKIPGGRSKDV